VALKVEVVLDCGIREREYRADANLLTRTRDIAIYDKTSRRILAPVSIGRIGTKESTGCVKLVLIENGPFSPHMMSLESEFA
jgi:hypothetical protein